MCQPKANPYAAPPSRLGQAQRIVWQLGLSLILALALSLSLWVMQATQAQGSIIHVTPTGDLAQTGNSWATATTLTQALTLATAGDEIWVATGVYTPGVTVNNAFSLKPGVALYGGFAATETVRTERDRVANLTILSGDIGGDDIDPDGDGVLTTTTHIVGSNSTHVVLADGTTGTPITETTVLSGFTITAGQANGGFPDNLGGGFYCVGNGGGNECNPSLSNVTFSGNSALLGGAMYNSASSPVLNNVTFAGNSADDDGGAMYNNGPSSGNSSPVLNNVTFVGNSADDDGGAMYNNGPSSGNSSPVLNNVTFSGNSASSGGAMFNIIGSPILSNVTFSGNSAGLGGGAMYNLGWFIYFGNSRPVLNNVTFASNSASSSGAMLNSGWDVYFDNSRPVLNNVTFAGNSASSGGAMLNSNNFPSLSDVTFSGNSALLGGAMYNSASSPVLNNVTFAGNSAGDGGGAMYNLGNRFFGDSSPILSNVTFSGNSARNGGAMYNEAGEMHDDVILSSASSPVLNNVTFADNSADNDGGAMLNDGRFGSSSPVLHNAILWGNIATNRGHQLYNLDATPVLSYTLIQSGTNHITGSGTFTVTYGSGSLTTDPLFVDADGLDNIIGTLDDDLRLSANSPAIDAGNNATVPNGLTTDLVGNPRFYDDTDVPDTGNGTAPIVDMGAYEWQGTIRNIYLPLVVKDYQE